MFHPAFAFTASTLWIVLLAWLTASGCTSSSPQTLTIQDSPPGTVYLEPFPDRAVQATHPIALSSDIIARTLRGIRVRDHRQTMQSLLNSVVSPYTAERTFSDEEADWLAPHIATALAKATPDQRVGFRLVQTSGATRDFTSGTVFAYGRSLQISLTHLPPIRKSSMVDSPPNRQYATDSTGIAGRELSFLPKEAQRPDTFRVGETDTPTLVIDYDLLAKAPEQLVTAPAAVESSAPAPPPTRTAAHTTADELQSLKDSLAKKDAEVEALKKEVEAIKQQLNEQQKSAQPKRKSKPSN